MNPEQTEIFKELLHSNLGYNNEINIENVNELTAVGENLTSCILKVDISLKSLVKSEERRRLNYMVKIMRNGFNDVIKKLIESLFEKEIAFYSDILPAINSFLEENKYFEAQGMFPECFGWRKNINGNEGDIDGNVMIILENLKCKGYSNIDRNIGFDLEGAKLVLKDLGRFHALSMALKFKRPDVFQSRIRKHCQPPYFPEGIILRKIISEGWMDAVLNQEKCKPYQDQMKKRLDMELDTMTFKVYRPVNEPYATLMHNDMWTNNTMQVIENGKLAKNKFVDFQTYLYGSPLCDMILFIWSSVQIPVVENHYEELVKHYHHHFFSVLKDFSCDTVPFEYEKILQQVEKDAPFELIQILYLASVMYIDEGEACVDISRDVGKFMSENIGKTAAKRMEYAISEFGKRGWIELK